MFFTLLTMVVGQYFLSSRLLRVCLTLTMSLPTWFVWSHVSSWFAFPLSDLKPVLTWSLPPLASSLMVWMVNQLAGKRVFRWSEPAPQLPDLELPPAGLRSYASEVNARMEKYL